MLLVQILMSGHGHDSSVEKWSWEPIRMIIPRADTENKLGGESQVYLLQEANRS